MSVEQPPTRRGKQPARGDAKLVQYDEYIDRQVESTRRVVKVVDLATSLVVLAAGMLAFLLAVAVVEHWVVPGGFSVLERAGLFVLLTGSVGYFAFRRLWPLVIRKVNPVYAAHAIEQTGPSLKNSLVNLLLFRQKRTEISDAVYHTLEEQAAQRLSRVPVDAAVDRTLLIRFGYVLVAIVAIAAAYKVFSPKDPVVAARRVLMPWANIVPASRVNISAIEPGAVTVSRGEFVDVSAEVRGIGDDDTVLLRYSTADGQAVDKSVPMKLSRNGLRYEGRLPDAHGATSDVGLAQNLTYRIEAGDARSLDYAVKVIEAPSILVELVEYDYPEYTDYVDRQVAELGDIQAIEGTRITLHARANGPIKEAHVDFNADGRRDLPMKAGDTNASASFLLALRDDRQTPEHASYVLRFANHEGRPNHNPVKHSIGVEPDYAPEAAIVAPQEKSLDVRLDETVAIEVEAGDDFALADVRLHGEATGHSVMDEPLLKLDHKGRFTARYQFTPSAHGLRAGDVVQYWVSANDNRTPTANATESERREFRIVSPEPPQQPPPDRIAQRDQPQRKQPGEGEQPEGKQQPQDGAAGQEEGQAGEQQPGGAGAPGQPGENQQPQQGQEGQDGQGQGGELSRDAQRNEESGEAPQNGGEDAPARERGEREGANDKQTGAGAAGGEPSQGSQPDGTRPEGNSGARPANGAGQNGDQKSGERENGGQQPPPNTGSSPVSSDGDNDAEAFERIQQHLERNGKMKDGEPSGDQNEFSRDEGATERGLRSAEAGKSPQNGGEDAPARDEDDRGEGSGAETKGGEPQQSKEQPGNKNEQTKSPGGEQTSTKGASGAGDEQQSQGAPNSQPEMKPTEKREQSPSQGEQSNKEEPPAGARGKRESDSQGEQGGDRAGGGEEGGGQKAPREGTGSAGQNQSADEGAGESTEQGTGNDSPDAGRDAVADKKTEQSGGETQGRGTKTREVRGDEQAEAGLESDPAGGEEKPLHRQSPTTEENAAQKGGEKSNNDDGKQGAGGESEPKRANDSANQNGAPTGSGGQTGTSELAPPRAEGLAPGGDEANLEYARKQTDLVLEKLVDQLNRKRVDQDLLKQLGWSEEELRKFVDRWQARKEAAERNDQAGDAAKRELDEALRSLGLRRGPMKQGQVKDDTLGDLREGFRGPVPLEYQERLRAYNQGVSRARQDGE
ncbi:MAG: hypothetical protein L0228_18295 [Planctomycetes bacterium]|nr:hypothetical protein [Planctomycetota bacterium]